MKKKLNEKKKINDSRCCVSSETRTEKENRYFVEDFWEYVPWRASHLLYKVFIFPSFFLKKNSFESVCLDARVTCYTKFLVFPLFFSKKKLWRMYALTRESLVLASTPHAPQSTLRCTSYVCVCVCVCARASVCLCVCVYVCMCVCVCLSLSLSLSLSVCMCVYICIKTPRTYLEVFRDNIISKLTWGDNNIQSLVFRYNIISIVRYVPIYI